MNVIKKFLNSRLDRLQFSAQVFVVGLVLSATFFLLAIDLFKTYRSEISIMVNAKSQIAISQQKQIFANILELPVTLSFYDRMLKLNPDVRDVAINLSQDERKEKWNEMVSVEKTKDSSVFKIAITADRETDSKQLASKTARTLFDVSALYYNVKQDIDLRIIDGPISKSQVPGLYLWLLLSIICGFAVAIILNAVFFVGKNKLKNSGNIFRTNMFFDFNKKFQVPAEKEIESLRNLYQSGMSESPFSFEEKESEQTLPKDVIAEAPKDETRFKEMKKLTKEMEADKYPNFSEMPVREKQESIVPDNLPIADESYFVQEEIEQPEPAQVVKEEKLEEIEVIKKEPTEAELKERLNQLLRGEF